MRIVHISDTHEKHTLLNPYLEQIEADVIVHSGDVSNFGGRDACLDFLSWFSKLPYKHKLFVPGNHDDFFEHTSQYFPSEIGLLSNSLKVQILINSGVQIDGVKFWGSPYTPAFGSMSFPVAKDESESFWEQIPLDTEVLITHGPAFGVLDLEKWGHHIGCKGLKKRIRNLEIKAHLFGHVHESYGVKLLENYRAFNSAALSKEGNPPQVFNIYC